MRNSPENQGNSNIDWIHGTCLAALLIIFSIFLGTFVATDQLSTLASDSIHYLVMAAGFSPWENISEFLQPHLATQNYPPLFPLLLGLSGLNRSLPTAHLFAVVFLIPALALFFVIVARQTGQRLAALLLTVLLMLLPGTWENAMGILSENLYLFLTLCALFLANCDISNKSSRVLLGILLALIILTRSIGFTLLIAYMLQQFFCKKGRENWRHNLLIPVASCITLLGVAQLLLPAAAPTQYLQIIDRFWEKELAIFDYLINQGEAFFTAWQTAILRYWTDDQPLPFAIATLTFALAVIGVVVGLREKAIHAWYVLLYCLIIVVWPYPGQMYRFLFPIIPLLLFHALVTCLGICRLFRQHRLSQLLPVVWAIILIVIVFPSTFFTLGRYQLGLQEGLSGYFDYYHYADIKRARIRSIEQKKIIGEISLLKDSISNNALIWYFVPEIVSYFGNLQSIYLPNSLSTEGYKALLQVHPHSHIYLTRLHPRKSSALYSGLTLFSRLQTFTHVRSITHNPITGQAVSMLLQTKFKLSVAD
ncbi:hypothetical protein ACFL17_04215 [Pseudomonadota bacterium]